MTSLLPAVRQLMRIAMSLIDRSIYAMTCSRKLPLRLGLRRDLEDDTAAVGAADLGRAVQVASRVED